jgi:hypothetical protein
MLNNSKYQAVVIGSIVTFAFVGCGGGSSSSSETVSDTYSISGTVPGTIIEAFCKNGSYFVVNSTDDGTANHPFTLELPKDVNCKLVMTTNENDTNTTNHIVTPIILNDGTTTSTYFELNGDINMGYVNLATIGQGVQTPLAIAVTDDKMKINHFAYDPLDNDNDGIPNIYEDDDGDGYTNKHDEDDDNDGIPDHLDSDYSDDQDGDGIEDQYDDDENDDESSNNTQNITLPTLYEPNNGRLLASQCAQCHGTNGISTNEWDSIAGEDDLASEMFDDEHPIMKAQANGYTSTEINTIESWLSTQNNEEE